MEVTRVVQPSNNSTSVSDRDRLESRTVSPQTATEPNAAPGRPVNQVPAVEELPDDNLVDVNQAREVYAREVGGAGGRAPDNPIESQDEASATAAAVREQIQADAGQALRAQASRTPSDVVGLLTLA